MKFRFNEIAKKFLKSLDKTAFTISFPQDGTTNTSYIMTQSKYNPMIAVEDIGIYANQQRPPVHKNNDDVFFITFYNETEKVAVKCKRKDVVKLSYILADTMRANGIECEVIEEKI